VLSTWLLTPVLLLVSGLVGFAVSIGATAIYLKGSALRLLASGQVNLTTGMHYLSFRAGIKLCHSFIL
jgi:hypothetical protein